MTLRLNALTAGIALASVVATSASAGAYLNTIDDSAQLHDGGNVIAIGGPIGCDKGQLIKVRVLVSQDGKAVGDGTVAALCTGEQERWLAAVEAWGAPAEPGEAEARAWATTWDGDNEVKRWSWGKTLTLENAAPEEG